MREDHDEQSHLNRLIDALDACPRDGAVCAEDDHRRHRRYPFRSEVLIHHLDDERRSVRTIPGRSRNVSRSGAGLLVRRTFAVGEPIEIEVRTPGRAPSFLSGLVVFCRSVGNGCHEIGLSIRVAGSTSLLKTDSPAAAAPDWLTAALQAEFP